MGNFEFSTEGGGGRRVTKERVIGLYKLQFFFRIFSSGRFTGNIGRHKTRNLEFILLFDGGGGGPNQGFFSFFRGGGKQLNSTAPAPGFRHLRSLASVFVIF